MELQGNPLNTPNMQVDVASGNTKAIFQKRPSQGTQCVTCLAGAKAQNEQDRGKSWEDCQELGPWAENTCASLLPAYLQTCENQASRACFTQVLKSEKEREVSSGSAGFCLVSEQTLRDRLQWIQED